MFFKFWWNKQINSGTKAPVQRSNINATLHTDASGVGWGAECNGISTGGNWSAEEKLFVDNNNYLELNALLFGLKSFRNVLCDKHVKVFCDNSTTVAYINHMGGTKSIDCNYMARQIWTFAL